MRSAGAVLPSPCCVTQVPVGSSPARRRLAAFIHLAWVAPRSLDPPRARRACRRKTSGDEPVTTRPPRRRPVTSLQPQSRGRVVAQQQPLLTHAQDEGQNRPRRPISRRAGRAIRTSGRSAFVSVRQRCELRRAALCEGFAHHHEKRQALGCARGWRTGRTGAPGSGCDLPATIELGCERPMVIPPPTFKTKIVVGDRSPRIPPDRFGHPSAWHQPPERMAPTAVGAHTGHLRRHPPGGQRLPASLAPVDGVRKTSRARAARAIERPCRTRPTAAIPTREASGGQTPRGLGRDEPRQEPGTHHSYERPVRFALQFRKARLSTLSPPGVG